MEMPANRCDIAEMKGEVVYSQWLQRRGLSSSCRSRERGLLAFQRPCLMHCPWPCVLWSSSLKCFREVSSGHSCSAVCIAQSLETPRGLHRSSVFAQEIVKGRSSFLVLQGFFCFSLWPFLLQQIYFSTLSSSYSERDAIQPLRTNLFEMNVHSLFPSLFSSFPLSFFFFLPLPIPSLSSFLSLCSPFLSSFIQVLWGEK